jgi:hypothetical protein
VAGAASPIESVSVDCAKTHVLAAMANERKKERIIVLFIN